MDELGAKVADAEVQETPRGKIVFASRAPLPALLTLRTVDNLYALIGRFRVGPHRAHLPDIRDAVAALDLEPALARLGTDTGTGSGAGRRTATGAARYSFLVNASRSGRHTYSRFEVAEAATQGILARHPTWRSGTTHEHQLEFRLDVADELADFALRLTPPTFRFRGHERHFTAASLRPPVAHALVWLSQPAPGDRFLDPFCGSGTILGERLVYPARRLVGGDRSAAALAAARANLPPAPHLTLARWDARRLPLGTGVVDKLVSNLPFGHQILSPAEIGGLYRDFVAEVGRILAPGGQAVVLTDQVPLLLDAADAAGLGHEAGLTLSLKGLHPQVLRLLHKPPPSSRNSSPSPQGERGLGGVGKRRS
ncbi:MAG TPA: methyltransferase domain-containing protein [Chloroflexota bacterium]|nr:methyltransferase domain-containing protein [Chloroflexota bacterium]